jgi:hypothetical protein
MNPLRPSMLLRYAIALCGLVPVAAGLIGVMLGPAMLADANLPTLRPDVALDSHYRYLSGLLLAVGLGFWSTLHRVELQTTRFRVLTAIVVVGGIGRLLGMAVEGVPGWPMLGALGMELVVTPLLCAWQGLIARRAAEDTRY